ncbi:hypothetical protein K439DRAFT_1631448 [Ramaria rubella]|nr:hypothetical protein K439DRAFT_1631448 [Ramaria rubella]
MLYLRFFFSLLSLSSSTLVAADRHGGGNDGDNGNDGDGDDTSPTSSASLPTGTAVVNTNGTVAGALQGDTQCPGSQLMCVTGTVNGSTVTYELQSTGSHTLGWMAIGFGSQMADTPMVIMWPNTDGTITLSQRQAPSEVMPTPVASPPKVATVATPLSTLSGSQPKLVFTIDGSATQQPLIWAFGTTRPAEPAGSTLLQHIDSGTFSLDLTKTISPSAVSGVNGTTSPIPTGSGHIPLLPYQKTIIAHAVIATFGFLFLLPGGVLLARYTRTISLRWFKGHWIIQAGIGGPVIIIGCALGFVGVRQQGVYIPSIHKTIGKALLGLYLAQCFLGTFIHFVKIPFRLGRPPQNYGHALLGLTIIALALYQVRLGYSEEWPNTTGRGPLGSGINIVWIVWVVLLAVLYLGGLAYLPRQFRQERANKHQKQTEEYRLASYEDSEDKLNERVL